jgi:hypothetical protein
MVTGAAGGVAKRSRKAKHPVPPGSMKVRQRLSRKRHCATRAADAPRPRRAQVAQLRKELKRRKLDDKARARGSSGGGCHARRRLRAVTPCAVAGVPTRRARAQGVKSVLVARLSGAMVAEAKEARARKAGARAHSHRSAAASRV